MRLAALPVPFGTTGHADEGLPCFWCVMVTATIEKPRGILNPGAGETKFQLSRHAPAEDISYFVECYWIVTWDLSGQEPYVQKTLPYPCVHLVFEKGNTR